MEHRYVLGRLIKRALYQMQCYAKHSAKVQVWAAFSPISKFS